MNVALHTEKSIRLIPENRSRIKRKNQSNLLLYSMDWISLSSEHQLEEIIQKSFEKQIFGILLFKHSTRCSLSSMALNRLERNWKFSGDVFPVYLLDLIKYPAVSAKIMNLFNVQHQSPQVLIIKNGKSIYNASHSDITVADIETTLNCELP